MKKKNKIIICIFILIIIMLIQSTVLKDFSVFGIKPNIILICVIAFAMFIEVENAAILGLVIGLLQDMLLGKVYGIYALVYLYICLLVGIFKKRFFPSNIIFNVLFIFLFSFVAVLLLGFVSVILNGRSLSIGFFLETVLLESVINGLFAILFIPIIKVLSEKLDLKEA